MNFSKKGDLFISSQTLVKEENILCLREESNVTSMNIYGYLWKNLSISTKCEMKSFSLKILAIFFINKKCSTFFCFFAFLEYHGTLRISLFSKLSAWENILTVIVRYPKLPNHSTMHTCVLSRSIFGVILTYPSRISSVRRVGSSGFFSLDEPRNDPIGFASYPKMFSIISNIV